MTLQSGTINEHQEQGGFHPQPSSVRPLTVDVTVLPLVGLGLFIVLFGLVAAPWPADFTDAQAYDAATHWNRLLGNDVPAGWTDAERPPGYLLRRAMDGTLYVGLVFAVLCIIMLGILRQAWLYLPVAAVGFYGMIYAATAGPLAGPLCAGGGFALAMCAATLGWFSSQLSSGDIYSEKISEGQESR